MTREDILDAAAQVFRQKGYNGASMADIASVVNLQKASLYHLMHASRVVASSETYFGLVELGAGVIPAGGGTKEIIRRIVNPPMRTENADVLTHLQRAYLQIGRRA